MELTLNWNQEISSAEMRQRIIDFEKILSETDGAFFGDSDQCPITEFFAEGVYVRQMFVPKGTVITGKIHNLSHINIMASGVMDIVTEDSIKRVEGPCCFVSPPGTKKVGYAITDCYFYNAHPNPKNVTDTKVLEKKFVSSTFEDYQNKIKPSFFKRLLNLIN